jgi:hypothetical protein
MKQKSKIWYSTLLIMGLLLIISVSCKKDKGADEETNPVVQDDKFNFTVSKTQEAFVLLSTATWCDRCWEWGIPALNDAFAGKDNIDTTKLNGIALHYSDSDPLYNSIGETIRDSFEINDGVPNLWIEFSNAYNLDPTGWVTAIKNRQNGTNPTCALALKKEKNGNSYNIYVKVIFYAKQTGKYNLAVYTTENGIVAPQETLTSTDSNFVHKHVFRGEISNNSPWGIQMFNGTSVFEYHFTFVYTPASGVNMSNIHFVGVI